MSKNREGQSNWSHRSAPGSLLPREGCCVWNEAEGGAEAGSGRWEKEEAELLTRDTRVGGAAKG